MEKGDVFQVIKKIRGNAERLRAFLSRSNMDGETRRAWDAEISAILHECRISYEALTGGPFHYDPVAVRSRKVAGGY